MACRFHHCLSTGLQHNTPPPSIKSLQHLQACYCRDTELSERWLGFPSSAFLWLSNDMYTQFQLFLIKPAWINPCILIVITHNHKSCSSSGLQTLAWGVPSSDNAQTASFTVCVHPQVLGVIEEMDDLEQWEVENVSRTSTSWSAQSLRALAGLPLGPGSELQPCRLPGFASRQQLWIRVCLFITQ